MSSALFARLGLVSEANLRGYLLGFLADSGVDKRFAESYLPSVPARAVGVSVRDVYVTLVGEGLAYPDPSGQGNGMDNWRLGADSSWLARCAQPKLEAARSWPNSGRKLQASMTAPRQVCVRRCWRSTLVAT
jgi:hypothetical protein